MRVRRGWFVWLCFCVLPCCVRGQGSQPRPGERIGGKVVSVLDGRPLRGAIVRLEDVSNGKEVGEAITGDTGSFRFDPVPAGKYRMLGRAAGYLGSAYLEHGQFSTAIVTGAGLPTGSLVMKLTPNAEITGQITDETGEPLEQATVTLYRENPMSPEERIRRLHITQTNDLGRYEFSDLAPGHYFVTASGRPWYAVHPTSEAEAGFQMYRTAVDPGLDVAYPMLFYPGASNEDGATPIVLSGGSSFVANMQMTPQRALTLTLRGATPPNGGGRFAQLTRSTFGVREPVNAQSQFIDGNQEFIGLAPGEYTLQGGPNGSGGAATRSGVIDLTGTSLTIDSATSGPLSSVHVTVHDASGAVPAKLQVSLRDVKENRGTRKELDDKGGADFDAVEPGDYRVYLFGQGHVKGISSVAIAGKAIPDQLLHVTGSGTATLDVTASGDPVELTGFARHDGKPVAGTMVVLVPAGSVSDKALYRRDQSDLDGSFTLHNVVPGQYLAVAIDDGWTLRWDDSQTMLPYLLHAVPVAVPPGGAKTMVVPESVITQSR